MISITINNGQLEVPERITVLEASRLAGIDIPTLCNHDWLRPIGACRLCLVEIEGVRKLQTSCTTRVIPGMTIRTETPAVLKARRTILEFLLANHALECPWCDKAGECRLQELVFRYGPAFNRFREKKRFVKPLIISPMIDRDLNKCIQCVRCVRVCQEVQGVGALTNSYRGPEMEVGPFFGELQCEFCGHCLMVCPVGALSNRLFTKTARSWELTEKRSICHYCGCGCTFFFQLKEGDIKRVISREEEGANRGSLCSVGRFGFQFPTHSRRLKHPLIRRGGRLVEVSWKEAISRAVIRLKEVKEKHGGPAVAGLGSPRISNEDAYLFQKFLRSVIGTNHIDSSSRLGFAGMIETMIQAFGIGGATHPIETLKEADGILVIGADPTSSVPILGLALRHAADRGTPIVVIDPRKTSLADRASLHLPIIPGADAILLNLLIGRLLKAVPTAGLKNEAALREATAKMVLKTDAARCGLSSEEIRETADFIRASHQLAVVAGHGLTQSAFPHQATESLFNLMTLLVSSPKREILFYPVAGRKNSQGTFDMGISPGYLPGMVPVSRAARRKSLEKFWGGEALSGKAGLTAFEILQAVSKGEVKALYCLGENPLVSFPDRKRVEEALEACSFLMVQDLFLTETAQKADVVFPALPPSERPGSATSLERRIQAWSAAMPAVGEGLPDGAILTTLARALGAKWPAYNPLEVWEEIEAVNPDYSGLNPYTNEGNGRIWPPTGEKRQSLLNHDRFSPQGFFSVTDFPDPPTGDDDFPFLLLPGEELFHNGSLSRFADGLLHLSKTTTAVINPVEGKRLGTRDGGDIRLISRRGEVVCRVVFSDRVPEGMVWASTHFTDPGINELTRSDLDPVIKTPRMKATAVAIRLE